MTAPASAPVPVLVTAIGGGGHGEQILKALREADTGRYRIFGADMNGRCPQFRLVERGMTLPSASDPAYIDAVLDVCRRLGVRAVFHGCEPELRVMAEHRARFAEAGILLPINPTEVIERCMDKARTVEFLAEHGFEPPRSVEIRTPADLDRVDFLPAVIKPSRASGGSADCYLVQTRDELRHMAAFLGLDAADGSSRHFVVQEYVGTPDAEYTVGVLHDLDGAFINSIAVRRELKSQLNVRIRTPNRTGRKELGDTLVISSGISHGYVDRFPEVTAPCERMAAALGVRGPLNIQCRLVDGAVKVFEINPRFSGTTSIRAMMGYNEPDVLVRRHLLGETIETRFAYERGLVLRCLSEQRPLATPTPSWQDTTA